MLLFLRNWRKGREKEIVSLSTLVCYKEGKLFRKGKKEEKGPTAQ